MTAAMDHDLNLPQALGHLFALAREVNRLLGRGLLDQDQRRRVLEFLGRVNEVLAVMDFSQSEGDEEVDRLVARREAARQEKDFAAADELRDRLARMGVQVIDTPEGPRWQRG
jgi:cysteinyl-tRNA synthetase